jgi:flagellar basal-body rod modification protein FlgD
MAIDFTDYVANQRGAVGSIAANTSSDALVSGQDNLDTSYTTFLKLLTTQLKNQDPTSPLDTNAFTQQLVQMTGVQQQLLSNKLLQQLVTQGSNADVRGAVDLIGKTVSAVGSDVVLKDGKASWNYELDQTASKVTLSVVDSKGRVMWSGDAPDLGQGEHAFTWDGKGVNDGAEGQTYTLQIKAVDANGDEIASRALIEGLVTAIHQGDSGALVTIGGADTDLTAVRAVKG